MDTNKKIMGIRKSPLAITALILLGASHIPTTTPFSIKPPIITNSPTSAVVVRWQSQLHSSSSTGPRRLAHDGGVQRTTRDPDMRNCKTIEEVTQMAYDHVDNMSPRGVAAYWTLVSKFLQQRSRGPPTKNAQSEGDQTQQQMAHQFDSIFVRTLEGIESCGYRDLAQTTMGLGKIMKFAGNSGKRLPKGSPHQILHNHLVVNGTKNKQIIFDQIARASIPILHEFDARSLSNFIYAFAIADYAPKFEDGSTFYDILAQTAIPKLKTFNSHDLSNMLWAYATAKETNSALFEEAGDTIVALGSLNEFNSQHLSNILWAYATSNESHPKLFKKIAGHIDALDNLEKFYPQALSNISWAYATARESYPQLFKKIADSVITRKYLIEFKPQALSNIVWAFATANESHPKLFKILSDHITALDNLDGFKPEELSDLVWAYASMKESHPLLFQKVAEAAIKRQTEFDSPGIANLVWAFASNGQIDQHLFTSLEPTVGTLVSKCNSQELANIAWAYAVANVAAPSVFNDDFIQICLENEDEFTLEALSQLHQWQLWQEQLETNIRLPPSLEEKCNGASVSTLPRPSDLQHDVISELSSSGLQPEEEALTKRG
mmetsp:Transcript_31098/g.65629  ORF Transcript_31098/g.65629 Transcript_31098/m.65629 type:complete len:606 (+) Transcript_31098:219-2036(+)